MQDGAGSGAPWDLVQDDPMVSAPEMLLYKKRFLQDVQDAKCRSREKGLLSDMKQGGGLIVDEGGIQDAWVPES